MISALSTYLNLGLGELAHTKLTVELAEMTVKYPKRIAENILVGIGKFVFLVDFIILDMPEDIKVPLILERPFLYSLSGSVYMLSLRERMELDLEAKLIGETLLRTNQGDDLMPTIEEGEVIEEFRTRDDELDTRIDDYPSYCDYDKKIHIDCAHNLKFSCMTGFEFTHINFFPLLYANMMSKKFHNSIMKDKIVYKGNNVVGALMNMPNFVGIFSVVTDFAVKEDMDAYRDKGMGDAIFGEPFLREVGIKARRLSIRRIQTPWIRRIDLRDFIQSLFFSTVDTAYSLNEYSVFDTGPRWNENDKVGGMFINMEISKCWSLEISRRLFNTNSCTINLTWRIYRANIRGVSHSNSF
ncbi:hypothetical protein Tco_0579542 [Tanacetum coccineum]